MIHIVQNTFHHAIGSWRLGFGVRQFRVKFPTARGSQLLFLSSFSPFDGPAVDVHAMGHQTRVSQNHEVPTNQTGQNEAGYIRSSEPVTGPGQTRPSCAVIPPQNARSMLYKSVETRKTNMKTCITASNAVSRNWCSAGRAWL